MGRVNGFLLWAGINCSSWALSGKFPYSYPANSHRTSTVGIYHDSIPPSYKGREPYLGFLRSRRLLLVDISDSILVFHDGLTFS